MAIELAENIKRAVEGWRAAGKDVSGLEKQLEEGVHVPSKVGCCQKRRGYQYISTGPIRKSDSDDNGIFH